MPRCEDIESVLVLGSGPIVIGQAAEFDYSGTQGLKVLKDEGFRVILVNSNPATIMTDPEFADATYIEPITPEHVAAVIRKERPDALLPTLGGQTALNVAVELAEAGLLEEFGVELVGASVEAIRRAEDRRLFKETMERAGLALPRSAWVYSPGEAKRVADELGYPLVIRPSFMLGGGGSSVVFGPEELEEKVSWGLANSRIGEVLLEESVLGWKEFELEVMRDAADNAVVVCSIENFDPMGVHTGDSITVAPAQTLTDREYQEMRDDALTCIRAIGVETGGSNIQFAVEPSTGRRVIIEMNPRVSRSSALASKATGFPIAKIATKLAVGYTLDEIPNDITRETYASFEPTLDYVVVKVPRFDFEKFPEADPVLGTQMKSVGEVMAMGRTFKEALQKALRSLEKGRAGLGFDGGPESRLGLEECIRRLARPTPERFFLLARALELGASVEELARLTGVDPWFLSQMRQIVEEGKSLARMGLTPSSLARAKRLGFSDLQLAHLTGKREEEVRAARDSLGLWPVYKTVDTCAAEFEAHTPYHYSTYEEESEVRPGSRPRVVVLGAGPNRIGQGIEFDYCCVHAAFALKEMGYEAVMVNCNPETVSTDYDTSDRLYFEPLTLEDVLAVCRAEEPLGVIATLGGQSPLKLAKGLEQAGVKLLGTGPEAIDRAEDRERFARLLDELGLRRPPYALASSPAEALKEARRVGYPVLVRPSYVLGGRAMEIAYTPEELARYVEAAAAVSPEHPVYIDAFLEDAVEAEVDAVFDGEDLYVGGVLEHIEEAGIHSGDSAAVLPPQGLSWSVVEEMEEATRRIAAALGVRGLVNVQFALAGGELYVLEANPRASRTVPFISKATGVPLAKVATRVMLGERLRELWRAGLIPAPGSWKEQRHVAVKEAVLPFLRFPGVDTVLGPEMKSTGEVMGLADSFGEAFAKSQEAAGTPLRRRGRRVLCSLADRDKGRFLPAALRLKELGFSFYATAGTARALREAGIEAEAVKKVSEGHPNALDLILGGEVDLVINTPSGRGTRRDGYYIRTAAWRAGIPLSTTLAGARAAVEAFARMQQKGWEPRVLSLQERLGGKG